MNYHRINKHDVANGEGIRVSLFVSGCHFHCPGCFNQETWNRKSGSPFTQEAVDEILEACDHDYIAGLSLLGGEPMEDYNQPALIELVSQFKERYPDKTVWCWSGYDYRTLFNYSDLLSMIDVLVDKRFEEDKKDLRLKWRGSTNQRVIDVKESMKQKKVVTIEE